ncbi:MAG: hypothetical protein ABEJ55_03440 [Halanaeroarchaeum sp.]
MSGGYGSRRTRNHDGGQGAGEWQLTPESGETVTVSLDDVDGSEEREFSAAGPNDDRGMLYELSTGPQPGGDIRLRRRSLDGEEWDAVGSIADATKLG